MTPARASLGGGLGIFAGAVHLALGTTGTHRSSHEPGSGFQAHDPGWLDPAFVVVGLLMLAAAAGVMGARRSAGRVLWCAATSTAVAYVVSRTAGLPSHPPESWDLLGISALLAEAGVAALCLPDALRRRMVHLRRLRLAPLLATAVVGSLMPAVVAAAGDGPAQPGGCPTPTRAMALEAVQLPGATPDGGPRLAYRVPGEEASTPGPLIEMVEGECLAITLTNRVPTETLEMLRRNPEHPLGVSLHVHGVKYTVESDGTVGTGSYVPPGQSRTYIWYAAPRTTVAGRVTSLGTAGYWWYHDHVGGTSHGTGGVNAGLWGGLIVRRAGDVPPDRTYVVGLGGPGPLINHGARFACPSNGNTPGPDCFYAEAGDRVEFLVIGVPGPVPAEDFHEFHLHGHNWADNRTGMLVGPTDETRVIDAKVIGPSESFGFQVVAGESVGAGDWMLHCHVQGHSDAGMSTYFRVEGGGPGAAFPHVQATHDHGEHSH